MNRRLHMLYKIHKLDNLASNKHDYINVPGSSTIYLEVSLKHWSNDVLIIFYH